MQLEDVGGTGLLVQAVDVLGDDPAHQTQLLDPGHGAVGRVGAGRGEALPAGVGPSPVALPTGRRGHELTVLHRLHAALTVGSAVVGDARAGGHPRAGEHDHLAPGDQLEEPAVGVRVDAGAGREGQVRRDRAAGSGIVRHGSCHCPTCGVREVSAAVNDDPGR